VPLSTRLTVTARTLPPQPLTIEPAPTTWVPMTAEAAVKPEVSVATARSS